MMYGEIGVLLLGWIVTFGLLVVVPLLLGREMTNVLDGDASRSTYRPRTTAESNGPRRDGEPLRATATERRLQPEDTEISAENG